MASKITLVVVVVFVALQGTNGASILDVITNQINTQISTAVNNTKAIEASISDKIANVSETLQEQGKSAISKLNDSYNSAVKKAKAANVAVEDCTKGTNDALKAAIDSLSSGTQKCVADARASLQPNLDELKAIAQQGLALIDAIRVNASKCDNFHLGCTYMVQVNAQKEAASLAIKFGTSIASLKAKEAEVGASASSCEITVVQDAVKQAQAAIQGPTKCIQDKVNAAGSQ